jgi:hypothetical protein
MLIYEYTAQLCRTAIGCSGFRDSTDFIKFLNESVFDELKKLTDSGKRVVILLPFPTYPVCSPLN